MAALAKSPALQMTPFAFATEMRAARNEGYKSGKTAAAEEAKAARARDIQANEALLEQRIKSWRMGLATGALMLAV